MRFYLLLLFFFISATAFSQSKASEFYNAGYYKEAALHFEQFLEKEKNEDKRIEAQIKLADSYYRIRNLKAAKENYEVLVKQQTDSLTLVRLVELNRNFCDYFMAGVYFKQYSDKYLTCEICDMLQDHFFATKIYYPENNDGKDGSMVEALTIPHVSQGMGYSFYERNKMIFGAERKHKEDKTTFYDLALYSTESSFSKEKDLDISGNNPYFRSYPSYDERNKTLYFSANASSKSKFKPNKSDKYGYSEDGVNVLQIYAVKKEGEQFGEPELMDFNDNNYNFTHPSISDDGQTLYFVSDKPGGKGGYDVYYVTKKGQGWSQPKNCGATVNTDLDELTPNIVGDTLYFSSYGHNNFGGSDVFISLIKNGTHSPAENMGKPVNSCKDDFSFLMNSDRTFAYVTSNRNSETGERDEVLKITFPPDEFIVKDKDSSEPIPEVEITIDEDTLLTDENGAWIQALKMGEDTEVTFDNPWYEKKTLKFSSLSASDKEELKEVFLEPVYLSGQLIDNITGKPMTGVDVTLFVKNDAGDWERVEQKLSDKKGRWQFHIRKDKTYKVVFSKDKYVAEQVVIPRHDHPSKERDDIITRMNPFEMSYKPEKDVVMQIDNIYFDYDKATLRPESHKILDKLKEYLTKNKDLKIELSAHTDCIGSHAYNNRLSQQRAESCLKYLEGKGIAPGRIKAIGYGKTRMIIEDCELQKQDDSAAQKNRRVEVKIL